MPPTAATLSRHSLRSPSTPGEAAASAFLHGGCRRGESMSPTAGLRPPANLVSPRQPHVGGRGCSWGPKVPASGFATPGPLGICRRMSDILTVRFNPTILSTIVNHLTSFLVQKVELGTNFIAVSPILAVFKVAETAQVYVNPSDIIIYHRRGWRT